MLKRIVEKQGQAFVGIESARAYAEEARSPFMRMGYGVGIRSGGGNPCEGSTAAFRPKVSSPTENRPVARAIRNLRKGG